MKDKGTREIKKKPQTDKIKVKSDYQIAKGKTGDSFTSSTIKKN